MSAVAQIAKTLRPWPPTELVDTLEAQFEPSQGLEEFVDRTFMNDQSPLFNPDHAHLVEASIGYLWTNVSATRQMIAIAGMTEIPKPPAQSSQWAKERYKLQLRQWFGTDRLDFVITIDANYAKQASDIAFCALIDHELYHCAQKLDEFGSPKFNKETGLPYYGLLGHDVEEFVGIVRRYGANAGAGKTAEFIKAAKKKAEIAELDVKAICGSCA
jgi:hypothetical protein